MDVPTAAQVRDPKEPAYSELLSADFTDDEAGNAALQTWLGVGARLVASLTCRLIGDSAGEDMVEVPDDLIPLADRAISWRTEVLVQRGSTSKARKRAIRNGNLASISAGPWSETYFGPDAALKARVLDPDPDLHALLWALATPDCRDAWTLLWTGVQAPAATPISFEYGNRPGGGAPAFTTTQEFL